MEKYPNKHSRIIGNMKIRNPRNGRIVAISAILVGVVLLSWIVLRVTKRSVAFTVDGQAISMADYQKVVKAGAKAGKSESNVRTLYITVEKERHVAKAMNITLPDWELNRAFAFSKGGYNPSKLTILDEYQTIEAYDKAIYAHLAFLQRGGYSGVTYVYPFDKTIDQPADEARKAVDINKLMIDKKYAQQKATEDHLAIQQKTKNGSAILATIINDNKLQYGTSGNDSKPFMMDKTGTEFLELRNTNAVSKQPPTGIFLNRSQSWLPYIKDIQEPKTTSVQLYRKDVSPGYQIQNGNSEVAFIFFDVQSVSDAKPNAQTDFSSKLSAVKVKVNVK